MNPMFVASKDGTAIAYETRGNGPLLIMIGGANNTRMAPPICAVAMAELLAPKFTAVAFDRRGRGDSGNTLPYAIEREIEDVAALIEAVGGPVRMFGHSSGGALILECARAGLPVAKIAIYEPPYSMDAAAVAESDRWIETLKRLNGADKQSEAAEFFMSGTGMPKEMIDGMKHSPMWPAIEKLAPTLVYDSLIAAAGGLPEDRKQRFAGVGAPVLAMAGGTSPDWMKGAAKSVADAVLNGKYREVPGVDHMVDEGVIAPILIEFLGGK